MAVDESYCVFCIFLIGERTELNSEVRAGVNAEDVGQVELLAQLTSAHQKYTLVTAGS